MVIRYGDVIGVQSLEQEGRTDIVSEYIVISINHNMGTEANLSTIDDVHDIPVDEGCEAIRQRTRNEVHAGHSSNTVSPGRP